MNTRNLGLIGSVGLGAGLGAGLMYLLDPKGGDRRRARVRHKADQAVVELKKMARRTSREFNHRKKALSNGGLQGKEKLGATLGAVGLGLLARGLAGRGLR